MDSAKNEERCKLGQKGRGVIINPLGIVAGLTLIGVLFLAMIFIHDYLGKPKDEEILDATNISLSELRVGEDLEYDVWLDAAYSESVEMTMTVYLAFLNVNPSSDIDTAISQVRNAEYRWIETYTVNVPRLEPFPVKKDYGDALAEYLPEMYAITFIELKCGANTWVWGAEPKYSEIATKLIKVEVE